MQAAEAQYQQSKGVELSLTFGDCYSFQCEGSPLNQYAIDSAVTLHSAVSKLSITADNMNLEGKNIPLYYTIETNKLTDVSNTTLKLKLPATANLIIDGKEDTLAHFVAAQQSVAFHQLSITGAGQDAFSIVLDATDSADTLIAKDGQLQIVSSEQGKQSVTVLSQIHQRLQHKRV
jgi:hypothetical protein